MTFASLPSTQTHRIIYAQSLKMTTLAQRTSAIAKHIIYYTASYFVICIGAAIIFFTGISIVNTIVSHALRVPLSSYLIQLLGNWLSYRIVQWWKGGGTQH